MNYHLKPDMIEGIKKKKEKRKEGEQMLFAKPGIENTKATLEIAVSAAIEKDLDIVLASNTGDTVFALLEIAEEKGFHNRIVAITHAYGVKAPGEIELSPAARERLEAKGVGFVTAAHALSGGERGISKVFGGVYPVELIAAALRMWGQGVKVCVEIALMALDHGAISYGKPVIAVGGSSRGADTCCILTPSYTAKLLDTKIHEVLCKPSLYEDGWQMK